MHHAKTGRQVLVVAPDLPHAPLTGAHTRPLSIVRALMREHDVTVVGAAAPGADLSALRETGAAVRSIDAAPYARSAVGAALARARQLVSPVPLLSRSYFEGMGRAVQDAIEASCPDVLHLVSMYSCWYRDDRSPAVIDLLDVVSGLCDAAATVHPWRYAPARIQRRTSATVECRELAKMADVMTINYEDADRLRALGIDSTVVPLAVTAPVESELARVAGDTEIAGAEPGCDGGGRRVEVPLDLLFVGNFRHQPNRAAAEFIRRRMVPELRRRGLRFTVTIAGHGAGRTQDGPPDATLTILDDVADLAPLYRRADIVLVPVPFGGGTKNKTLEALAWGKPVVGTPQAFTGIGMPQGIAFISVPLEEASMAEAVARLAANARVRAAMGAAGRAYVRRNHSQDIVDERVAAVYAKVLGSGA